MTVSSWQLAVSSWQLAVDSWLLAVVRAGCLGLVRDRVATLRKLIFYENLRAAIKYCCEKPGF
ncbi:MAG: hypothetical protein ABI180_13865 [Microcoleus sp.]